MNDFATFLKRPPKTHYYGEDKDEHILYVVRGSPIVNIPWLLQTILMAIAPFFALPYINGLNNRYGHPLTTGYIILMTLSWYLLVIGFAFIQFLHWYFNVYIITNKKLLDMEYRGLTYKNIAETTLDNIEDVTSVVNGNIGAIFNIGSVVIQTAGEMREFDFDNVHNPARLRDIIADLRGEQIESKETDD